MLLPICVVLCASVIVFLLWKDRDYWRSQYQTLDRESRERERHIFDQQLLKSGLRPVGDNLKPVKAASAYPVLGEGDIEILTDKVNERVEHNIITYGEATQLISDAMYGKKTTAEVDRVLWERQQASLLGSVVDVLE